MDKLTKLSFSEQAEFFAVLATIEKHYGKEKTLEAAKKMVSILEMEVNKYSLDMKIGDGMMIPLDETEMELTNKEKIIRYFEKNNLDPEEGIIQMYEDLQMTQKEIGLIIGVTQRSVGHFINDINEIARHRLYSRNGFI